ncbi:protein ROS1-like isoform X2 [Iris pallida]|uniref:Protein ROS1-like isoform X2 n=1 Tax=Iris pallida TaxID=29817 RepID=A0AAX6FJH9_IRIPA|nr:protein ROS1-like isoform X2 [Iris pallida]
MDLSRGVTELKQQQTLYKEKDDAPGVEYLDSPVDVPMVQTTGFIADGITSVLLGSSQEKSATSSADEIMTSPLAPITPNKCQRIQDWQPVQVVQVVSEGSEKKGTLQTASVTDSLDVCIGNDFLKLLAPVTPDKSRPIQDYQPRERDLSDGRLSKENDECMYVEVPPQVEQIRTHEHESVQLAKTAQDGKEEEEEEGEGEEGEEIGLMNTPRKNAAKRKKHRPKVIQEGKPAKKPKPIPSANRESPTPKRVYVRRKNILKTPLGADGENMDQCSLKAERSNADQLTKTNTKSVRRSLNFDLVSQEGDGCQLSPVINVESRAQETFAGSTDSCSTKFTVKLTQGLEVVMNKSPVGIAFDLSRSLNQMLEEYIALPERPITSAQACTGDTVSKQLKNFDDTNRMQTDQGQINSDSHTDAILIEDGTEKIGMKRDCDYIEVTQHPSSYECLRDRRFMHVYTRRKGTSKSQVKNSLSLYIPEIHKKRRTEKVKARRCNKAVWSTFRDFSFADGRSSRTLDGLQDSELMLAISSLMITTKKRSKIPTRARKPTSVDFIEDSKYLLQTPEKLKESVVTSRRKKYGPQTCMEALFADTRYKLKTKKRTEKEQLHLVSSMPSNMKKEHEVTSFKFQSQNQQIVLGLTTQSTINFSLRNLNDCQVTSSQDHQLRSNILGPLCVNFQSRAIVPYMKDMDVILHKLKCLNLNDAQLATAKEQNALSHYWGGSTMVPYYHLFGLVKRKRPRARVDLDPETNRVWKVLMGSENIDGDAGQDMDKEKWWEKERQIYRGRVDSFIARMHLIQGDRRFSKWKGSVVDSVVGVFLTQNVSDHLSSSAFMSLAARYPLSSTDDNKKSSYPERMNVQKEERDECAQVADDAIKWQERMSTSEVYDLGSAAVDDSGSIGSNSRDGLHKSEGENLHVDEREQPLCIEGSQNNTDTPLNVTGSKNLAEAEDRVSMGEVFSSQNSILSQGNSLDTLTQTTSQLDSCLELITEADNLLTGSKCCSSDCSTLFGEHKLVRENITSKESYNDDEGILLAENWACTEDGKETLPYMLDSSRGSSPSPVTSDNLLNYVQNDVKFVQPAASMSYNFHTSSICGSTETGSIDFGVEGSCLPATSFEFIKTFNTITAEEFGPSTDQQILISESRITSVDSHVSLSKQYAQTQNCSLSNDVSDKPPQVQNVQTAKVHQEETNADFEPENICHVVNIPTQKQQHGEEPECPNSCSKLNEDLETSKIDKSSLKDEVCVKTNKVEMKSSTSIKKMKTETGKRNFDWDSLRREAFANCDKKERSCEEMDSLDWEAVRCADVNEISKAIRERGMNNVLAGRIKDFLNRLVEDHGSIDLEWLRDVPPDKAKEYLLSVRGLGLKSVECVLLLTLHHLAFPVDTNVGRVSVRLGWVPLQPLPESLQLHLLELYPMIEHIQKYLWPRLCTLDQETLYELHYQMITFGKVFCTKSKPNCNACPMRGDCKHFASAFASARLSLPGPEEKRLAASRVPFVSENDTSPSFSSAPQCQIEGNLHQEGSVNNNLDPIIEEPPTPEQECSINMESVIEDDFYEDPDDIPIIKLNLEEFTENLQNYMQENNVEMEGDEMSKALVALSAEAASIPMPKLKNVSRLRTEHRVYELPDSHPLLEEMNQREHNDPCPYLLVIWTPGETAQSVEPPQSCCSFQSSGELCDRNTCFACNSIREEHAQTVRGTLLIPCRTAMRGSFPLNGTYFQVNEVFADHTSSCRPVDVPRKWIWNLPRRTVYFGTSVLTIFRGLTTEEIQLCFWRGFVCVRGFDRASRAPKPLFARLHFSASKESNTRKMGPNEGQNNTSGTN